LRCGLRLLLQKRIALLDQRLQHLVLLRDAVRNALLIIGSERGRGLFGQLPDVVARDGDAGFEFRKR